MAGSWKRLNLLTVLRSVNQSVVTDNGTSKIPPLPNDKDRHTHLPPPRKHWKTPVLIENLKVRSFLHGSYWGQLPVDCSLPVDIRPIPDWLDYPVCDILRLLWAVKFCRFSWELTPLVLLSHLPDNIHRLPWSSFSQSRILADNCCKALPAQHPVADAMLWLLLSNVPLRCFVI